MARDEDLISDLGILNPVFNNRLDITLLPDNIENSAELSANHLRSAGLHEDDLNILTELFKLRSKYVERKFGSLLELVHDFIVLLGSLGQGTNDSQRYNVASLTKIISEYEAIQDNKQFHTLCAFLTMFASRTYDEATPIEEQINAVNVLTMHQAKGLEYDFVFLPMLVQGRFPLGRSSDRWLIDDDLFDSDRYKGTIDNERRLFYVACTRARKALYLTAPSNVGLKNPKEPSPFFDEARSVRLLASNRMPDRPGHIIEPDDFLVTGYSSLEYYLTCPYRYQMVVKYGIAFPKAVYFQFGKLIHDVFAHINLAAISGETITINQAIEYFDDNFQQYYRDANIRQYDIRKQQHRGRKIIEGFYQTQSSWLTDVVAAEMDFSYVASSALVRGRYDVLFNNKRGKMSILDYKTGRPHEGLRTDFQMQFYSLAANEQLGLPVDEAILYYVETGETKSFPVTSDFLHTGTDNLTHTISGILAKDFHATPRKGLCSQCEVKKICPHRYVDTSQVRRQV